MPISGAGGNGDTLYQSTPYMSDGAWNDEFLYESSMESEFDGGLLQTCITDENQDYSQPPTSAPFHPTPVSNTPSTSSASPREPTESAKQTSKVTKRQLNTQAARRYRQKRVDQMKHLEDELRKLQQERDELKLRVSKLEGEKDGLKSLLDRRDRAP